MKTHIKMKRKMIKFGDIEIQKQKFHQHNGLSLRDITKIVVSNKVFFWQKKNLNSLLATKKLKN